MALDLDQTASQTILHQAATARAEGHAPPDSSELVQALKTREKSAPRQRYRLADFAGSWRLYFITGTRKTRKQAGNVIGRGRYLPRGLCIKLHYDIDTETTGSVQNSVSLGPLKLRLTGPVKFWPQPQCLAFDFTQLCITVGGLTLYRGRVKPEAADQDFYELPLKEQAFFKYFWQTDEGIAARGRGGGLALWYRQPEQP